MKIAVLIPARMQSSRFPGKPLASIAGLPMIEHVRRRCLLAKGIDEVAVATCDEEIRSIVASFGGKVIMTSAKHFGCTDRIAEASLKLKADIIVNVQGDEPAIMPQMVEELVDEFKGTKGIDCANLMIRITDEKELGDPNVIKVTVDKNGYALYFSRTAIPFQRFKIPELVHYKQTGLYAFTSLFLSLFSKLEPSLLERAEGIDMLRALENGYRVKMRKISGVLIGVDTVSDLEKAERLIKESPITNSYLDLSR